MKNSKLKMCGGTAAFANTGALHAEGIAFVNEIAVGADGWAQLAPFGDYPGQAMLRQPDGAIKTFPAIQRLDRAAADLMVARFKSPWHRLKRYFTGCHIYAGHPDVPAFANDYPDKTPKGMIVDLEARADGLFCKPVFTTEGSELVETRRLRAFSAYWSAREIGGQPGPGGRFLKLYRPDFLKSAGLTNHPNLPVHLLNEAQPRTPSPVKKQILLDFLAAQGITLANEAPDDQIAAALHQLGDRVTAAESSLSTRDQELESLRSELANERSAHIGAVLDNAVAAGRITAAQRPDWATRLGADFANAAAALSRLMPTLKTKALTLDFGARKAEIANAGERRDALETLIRTEMAGNGGDYDRAFAAVQKANPALFAAMKQPQPA
ncbi:MAG TPA: phage protease [Verrucomicrobiae bacterium]|nr:phage protease [Verrucomicrobiae bacterium]